MLRNVLRVLLPLVILAAGFGVMKFLIAQRSVPEAKAPEETRPLVEVVSVVTEDLRLSVGAQGSVGPRSEGRLVAEVAGRITWVSEALVNGGFFEASDVLVRIDPTDYELAVSEAQVAISQAERRLTQEEADAALARDEWESLGRGEPASPLTLRQPQLAEARADLEAARARLQRAQRDVARCQVVAPYRGRVRSEQADAGQYVGRGAELAQIYSVDVAEVRLPLADKDLAFLDLPLAYRGETHTGAGPAVTLRSNFGGGEHRWSGRIVRTEGELDAQSRMVVAIAEVQDPYGKGEVASRPPLSVGMFVEAEIEGSLIAQAIQLPRRALRNRDQVFVVDDGRLAIRPVELVRAEKDNVILSGGLQAGDQVIVSPLENAVEGMSLRAEAWEPR